MIAVLPALPKLVIILLGALFAGFTTGFAGFGTGLVASGLWFHALPTAMVPPLVAMSFLVAQLIGIITVRKAFDWLRARPFLHVGAHIAFDIGWNSCRPGCRLIVIENMWRKAGQGRRTILGAVIWPAQMSAKFPVLDPTHGFQSNPTNLNVQKRLRPTSLKSCFPCRCKCQ